MQSREFDVPGLKGQLVSSIIAPFLAKSKSPFAKLVAEGLEIADADFETRRRVMEMLEASETLAVEDDEKVVYMRCTLGDDDLPVENGSTRKRIATTSGVMVGK